MPSTLYRSEQLFCGQLLRKEEVPPEQQEWAQSGPGGPTPHIKETGGSVEQSREGEQLPGLEAMSQIHSCPCEE
ncbi:gastrula zinc finger protein xFG20-1-like protein [Lates japonicus]|uniref:Gastrula zinc finger protein xFG20-1-like protein n=1 Tax=Lates japonicus TaxID=270547 RepID=A0AAD3NA40_LATJO|nr:gastrula zinc finger protein xFG20-1-like protein [Lates japonicus]